MSILFGKKKEKSKKQTEVWSVSSEVLVKILKKAVNTAVEEIESNCYILGPEIMFEYDDKVHFVGVKYDRKRAKKEGCYQYSPVYMQVYLDKQFFRTPEELYELAELHGIPFKSVTDGLRLDPDFKEMVGEEK